MKIKKSAESNPSESLSQFFFRENFANFTQSAKSEKP